MSELLAVERAKVDLETKEALAACWCGGIKQLTSKRRIAQAVAQDRDFLALGPTHDLYRLSKEERYAFAAKRFALAHRKIISGEVNRPPYSISSSYEYLQFLIISQGPDIHTMTIQYAMFLPTLRNQTSKEQKKAWFTAAASMAILGCYAQTEMAHGSDVKSLQTEARFDPSTKCFDLHTPNIGATKWWPAALGRTATHAIVHARLLLPDDSGSKRFIDHGVKPFFVQLRDLNTHENLPGIKSGDIGPTMGLVSVEEGWCQFEHVKIPAISLLSRYGHVTTNGNWISPPRRHAKRQYATMLQVRKGMVSVSSDFLGMATTIVVRYCTVRQQFKSNPNSVSETQVIDYPQVAHRTLPWIATAYALKMTGDVMDGMHSEMEERVERFGDDIAAAMEKEVHTVGSALKAVCTTLTVDGIEELRRVCGGHGYSMFSGLQDLYGNAMVNFTGEGENYMLILQSAQYLLKLQADINTLEILGKNSSKEGSASPNFSFIKTRTELNTASSIGMEQKSFRNISMSTFVEVFAHRAGRLVLKAFDAMNDKSTIPSENSEQFSADTNLYKGQWEAIQAAWSFGEYLIVRSFAQGLDNQLKSSMKLSEHTNMTISRKRLMEEKQLKHVFMLDTLCRLFALKLIVKNAADWLMDGYLTPNQIVSAESETKRLLYNVREWAVSLVDAMEFDDSRLNSAIGSRNGEVYKKLLDWAKREPMNKKPVIDNFEQHYGSVLRSGRRFFEKTTGKKLSDMPGIVQGSATNAVEGIISKL